MRAAGSHRTGAIAQQWNAVPTLTASANEALVHCAATASSPTASHLRLVHCAATVMRATPDPTVDQRCRGEPHDVAARRPAAPRRRR